MKSNSRFLTRIYRLKVIIVALVSLGFGVALLVLAKYADTHAGLRWLSLWPVGEIGGTLTAAGIFSVAWDYVDGKDKEAREDERIRRLLKESAPDFRDAVIAGFAETPDNMRGVATTETLDKLATNALALRLGDEKFAAEIYSGLLAQAIRTPERWEDVDINVRLSCIQERTTEGGSRSDVHVLLFSAIVTWEYTLVPSTRIQRFASTNDLDEFRELLNDVPATSTWFIPEESTDPREPEAFEVLSYSVDGIELPIRRSVRKHGQTYSVDLGTEAIADGKPVRIRHVYRTVVPRLGHRFRIALTQPTHGMRLVLDYTEADIAVLKVGDMISSATPAQVKFLPAEVPAKQVEVSVPGWLLPQAEVTFVWTLEDELPR